MRIRIFRNKNKQENSSELPLWVQQFHTFSFQLFNEIVQNTGKPGTENITHQVIRNNNIYNPRCSLSAETCTGEKVQIDMESINCYYLENVSIDVNVNILTTSGIKIKFVCEKDLTVGLLPVFFEEMKELTAKKSKIENIQEYKAVLEEIERGLVNNGLSVIKYLPWKAKSKKEPEKYLWANKTKLSDNYTLYWDRDDDTDLLYVKLYGEISDGPGILFSESLSVEECLDTSRSVIKSDISHHFPNSRKDICNIIIYRDGEKQKYEFAKWEYGNNTKTRKECVIETNAHHDIAATELLKPAAELVNEIVQEGTRKLYQEQEEIFQILRAALLRGKLASMRQPQHDHRLVL